MPFLLEAIACSPWWTHLWRGKRHERGSKFFAVFLYLSLRVADSRRANLYSWNSASCLGEFLNVNSSPWFVRRRIKIVRLFMCTSHACINHAAQTMRHVRACARVCLCVRVCVCRFASRTSRKESNLAFRNVATNSAILSPATCCRLNSAVPKRIFGLYY